MRVAFLGPLGSLAEELYQKFLGEHEVLITHTAGDLPRGWQESEAVVWSRWPVDRDLEPAAGRGW